MLKISNKPHADLFIKYRGLNFGPTSHLHPYFAYVSIKGSDKSIHLRRLNRAFVAQKFGAGSIVSYKAETIKG